MIYESTVYPGATQEVCVPILEHEIGLRFNEGFVCGQFVSLSAPQWAELLEPQGGLLDLKGTMPRSVEAIRL